jgi:hypothetical protein
MEWIDTSYSTNLKLEPRFANNKVDFIVYYIIVIYNIYYGSTVLY